MVFCRRNFPSHHKDPMTDPIKLAVKEPLERFTFIPEGVCFWLICVICGAFTLSIFYSWAQKTYSESISGIYSQIHVMDIGIGGPPGGGGMAPEPPVPARRPMH